MATATIPVTVSREAAFHITKLGMQNEFDRMLEYSKQNIPDLQAMEVTLEYDGEFVDRDPMVTLWCRRPDPGRTEDVTDWEWGAWFVRTFDPAVCIHFVMVSSYEAVNGR